LEGRKRRGGIPLHPKIIGRGCIVFAKYFYYSPLQEKLQHDILVLPFSVETHDLIKGKEFVIM
jgi:hypothetical protein